MQIVATGNINQKFVDGFWRWGEEEGEGRGKKGSIKMRYGVVSR